MLFYEARANTVFSESLPLLTGACTLLGLLLGVPLGMLAYRLPVLLLWEENNERLRLAGEVPPAPPPFRLFSPPSNCTHCRARLRPGECIPLWSFFRHRGRCAHCGMKISARAPIVEVLCALVFALCAWRFGFSWMLPAALLFSACVLLLCLVDFDSMFLPDGLSLGLLWSGLLCNSFGLFVPPQSALWGAISAWLVLWALYWVFYWVSGREGMGYGDFKFAAALGAWLGWAALPSLLLLASLSGICAGMAARLLRRRAAGAPIPFGPFLGLAGWVLLLWGEPFDAWLQALPPFGGL